MPILTSLVEYARGADGEPRFETLNKLIVFATNDKREIHVLRRDLETYGGKEGDVDIAVLEHGGQHTGAGAILNLEGAKALRDFLTRFIDQANERRVKEGR